MSKYSIVFFGAGPVAAKSLELLSRDLDIEAVVTKGPPAKKIQDYPVVEVAEKLNTKVLYANNKNDVDKVCSENIFKSKLGILIDYGVIVSEHTINSFSMGIINSHFSLLPEWRGADPITYSILSGQQVTGISLMMLTKGMDEGPVLAQEELAIEENETGVTLTEKLIILSDKALKNTLPLYLSGDIKPIDQIVFAKSLNKDIKPSYSNKISKQEGKINWGKKATEIEREIRAFQPWPRSYTEIGKNLTISVTRAKIDKSQNLKPGQILVLKNRLLVGSKENAIELLEVQPAGKNKMPIDAFLRGYLNKLFIQID